MKLLPYREGTWFAVPLSVDGYAASYAAGVVARVAPSGRIILAYLFGAKYSQPPTMADVAALRPEDAIRRVRTGDMGLMNRRWPIIGHAENWDRRAWPMPQFIRRADLLKRAWRETYCDLDPSRLEREESIPYDSAGLESDSLYGYGATESLMTKLLGQRADGARGQGAA
jgi:hypothetical protein